MDGLGVRVRLAWTRSRRISAAEDGRRSRSRCVARRTTRSSSAGMGVTRVDGGGTRFDRCW